MKLPSFGPGRVEDEVVSFLAGLLSEVAEVVEVAIRARTGRRRTLPVRALLVALLILATEGRPLHLLEATKLLYRRLSVSSRTLLCVPGVVTGTKSLLARYRCVRYLFHRICEVMDPSGEKRNRVLPVALAASLHSPLAPEQSQRRLELLEAVVHSLVSSSVSVLKDQELAAFAGSVGLDATPVPLYSRGPSKRAGTCASDPDGGWYVRRPAERTGEDHKGRVREKVVWALEATLVTMSRRPGAVPSHPNLVLGLALARPGEDPGGIGVRLLASLSRSGYPAGFLGADRGYTQANPERFHLPVRALGYLPVMDYKTNELGRQASSQGALLVDGCFYCPAMPVPLVEASADLRAGRIDNKTYERLVEVRAKWRLVRKSGPDQDGYERFSCPAIGNHPKLCCPLRPSDKAIGKLPVLVPPTIPPRLCTQSAVTIAPDIGARHRQEIAFGTKEWASAYAIPRNTVEGWNGYLKDTAHEALAAPDRRRVRGIAAQSIFCAMLVMAGNLRKVGAYRDLVADGALERVAARARRRRTSLRDHLPGP